MLEYRAYPIDDLGHMLPPTEFACRTDQEAIAEAKKFLNGKPIELWQGARLVARLAQNILDQLF